MSDDPALRRVEESITRLRGEQDEMRVEEEEVRQRERKAIIRIQADAERNVERIHRHRKDVEREIVQLEGERTRRQAHVQRETDALRKK